MSRGFTKVLALVTVLVLSTQTFAKGDGQERFPRGPHPTMTPGSLCDHPQAYRYPEKIAYCNRDVSSDLKRWLILEYDNQFGYSISSMDRQQFKIDHLIPLCAGGSNRPDNLWPQHVSVYMVTDELEPLICGRMAQGKLRQAEAVQMIREAKTDLSKVSDILAQLNAL